MSLVLPSPDTARSGLADPAAQTCPKGRRVGSGASLRRRIVIAVVTATALTFAAAAVVFILNARHAVRLETARALESAERLVREAARDLEISSSSEPRAALAVLAADIARTRHVSFGVTDGAGRSIPIPPAVKRAPGSEADDYDDWRPAPGWFHDLIAPAPTQRRIDLFRGVTRIGVVMLSTRPEDEVAEVWADALALGFVAVGGACALMVILILVLGRILRPISELGDALQSLERADYTVRLEHPPVAELDILVQRFNRLAEALHETHSENRRLASSLITVQDDERRRLAMELHDEFGPCLFGVRAHAGAILQAAEADGGPGGSRIAACARDIMAVSDKLQVANRTILADLQPMCLGQVPLDELLGGLGVTIRRTAPDLALTFDLELPGRSYGERVDLTVYRSIQESVLNAVKHGRASSVRVAVVDRAGLLLTVTVEDDGSGLRPGAPPGYGLAGMRDRIHAIGGSLDIADLAGGGTRVRARIPLEPGPPLGRSAGGGER
ncbi:ATP-binding protein [Prosthecomicrobium hirschii]|uniref:ATP-binding protein n=1 Tax=Prosthecodimorpha hirschii TaxID=665126 RepID=UPI00221FA134|nr:ATP-binding protein [Prosthecomicrobium hirschii]MCW1843058.1 HAMP domain-containing protein [Prosthecomicrobium hirschii]